MKFFFKILFFIAAQVNFSFASQPVSSYFNSTDSGSTHSTHQLFIGFNTTQVLAGDVELYVKNEFIMQHSILFGIGYDFNTLDIGKHLEEENQHRFESIEETTDENRRYFWGDGFAIRLMYEYKFGKNLPSGVFLSSGFIFKIHNYENYAFGDKSHQFVHSESAEQQIYGFSFYFGNEFHRKIVCIKPYTGLGIRILNSQIHRPEFHMNSGDTIHEENFEEDHVYPSIHLGLILLFRVKG